MSFLLNTHRVKYECACDKWFPLDSLYFCRNCLKPKCQHCVTDQVDITFCPTCLENVPPGDAKNRRHLCQTCYICPLCDSNLVTNVENDLYHLRCGTCRWSTRDAGLPDQAKSTEWPQHSHPYDEILTNSLDHLKLHSSREKMEKEKTKYSNKRRSNLGTLNIDRYNLQGLYNARWRAMLEPLQPLVRTVEPTADVPELDESVFTKPYTDLKSMNQITSQLFAMDKPLYPNRTRLVGKRIVRCADCERPLYKPEYSPTSIKSKIQMLGAEYIPDIRISRPVTLSDNHPSDVFISVSNICITSVHIKLTPINNTEDNTFVVCDTPTIEFDLHPRNDAVEVAKAATAIQPEQLPGCFVFKSGHRVGLRLGVTANPGNSEHFLGLQLQYLNKGISTNAEKQDTWISTNVKLLLETSES